MLLAAAARILASTTSIARQRQTLATGKPMTEEFYGTSRARLLADLKRSIVALTRLPVREVDGADERPLAEAAWAFPVVGLGIGLLAGAVYAIAQGVGLAPWPSAVLAVGSMVLATGALHEDGLADMADGFGGGRDRDAKLAIMRDSRIGTYGVVALILVFALRLGAIAEIAHAPAVVTALLAAAAMSRAAIVLVMALGQAARADGLGAAAGRADTATAFVALAIAAGVAFVLAGPVFAVVGTAAAAAAALLVLWIADRQIGGTTGDVLGASQQAAEVAALLVASVLA
jgi:adenosylcobinamide-GDP ribazoletransferase